MKKATLRVWFVPLGEGERRLVRGVLIPAVESVFDPSPPGAIAKSENAVLAELERILLARVAAREDRVERYLWEPPFASREVQIEVHPQTRIKKRAVIGKRALELTVSYAWCATEGGGFRVMVPRFGAWFLVEDLALAPVVLRQAISTWLLGEDPKSLHDFRWEGPEAAFSWSPQLLARLPAASRPDPDALAFPTLAQVADDWVALAARGKLPQVVGDSRELALLAPKLAAPVPPSLLVVGPPSVGKTTFVRRLARHLATRKREPGERPRRLWATSAERILAGMIYLGMWQERVLALVRELEGEGDWLYVGSLAPFVRPQTDGSSLAEVFEPPVTSGQLGLIAECTPAELERASRLAPTLVGEMRLVRIDEPGTAATMDVVRTYAERAGVRPIDGPALRQLVDLLGAFVRGASFPGKALRFVDWLAQAEGPRAARSRPSASGQGERPPLLRRDVVELFSKHTGIPATILSDDVGLGVDGVAARLSERVIGQPEAARAAARVVVRFKASLADPERPAGALLFVGPSGVGKTELAKRLAETLFGGADRLVRLDMSEYQAWGSHARLLDASPGASSLARRVAERPLSVVLLDEIEKAHPDVLDVLLGVLGEGRLTDSAGRLVDFRSTIVVLTSNLGAGDAPPVGFGSTGERDPSRAVRDAFRPELVARLDAIVPFRALAPEHVVRIAELELASLASREGLARRGVRLAATPAALAKLAKDGFHPLRGARPLKRLVEERVVVPIAAALSAAPERAGFVVRVRAAEELEPPVAPGAPDALVVLV